MASKVITETPKTFLCGWCASATVSTNPTRKQHARCRTAGGVECVCAANGHKLNTELASRMAQHCHTTVEHVYDRHGQKQRVLSDERKEQLRAQLAKAREAKS